MDEYLKSIKNPDQQYQRQVQYILKQLQAPPEKSDDKDSTMSQEEEGDDEDENEDDYDSEEEDEHFLEEPEDQMIFQQMGPEMKGESFLEAHFKGSPQMQDQQVALFNKYMMMRQQNMADLE